MQDFDRRRLARRSMVFGGAAGLTLAAAGLTLAGCGRGAGSSLTKKGPAVENLPPRLARIDARPERIFSITTCLRPVRAQGIRIEAEHIGDTLVVHNYGHGGGGLSSSWGTAYLAMQIALANSPARMAVVGCGIAGLTSAVLATQAGVAVTIYARDLFPQTFSSHAEGVYGGGGPATPQEGMVGSITEDQWEQAARFAHANIRQYLGLPGSPVEWRDYYSLSDIPFAELRKQTEKLAKVRYKNYSSRVADLQVRAEELPEGATQFPVKYVRRTQQMILNVPEYSRLLLSDFFAAGGKFVRKEFHAPNDLTKLSEKVVINCPGYAAREWWNDKGITPHRGQIAWLPAQSEVNYGLSYVSSPLAYVTSRRDAIAVQGRFEGDFGGEWTGWDDGNMLPDRAVADRSVRLLGDLMSKLRS